MASQDDMLAQVDGVNRNLAKIADVMSNRFALSAFQGSFTMANAATYTVSDTNVKANSKILLQAYNAAAGTLQAGAAHLYISAQNAGASFQVATASGGSAAGTEIFGYIMVNTG